MANVLSLSIGNVLNSLFVAWGTNGTATRSAQSSRIFPETLEWYTSSACSATGNAKEAHVVLNSRLVQDGFVIQNEYVIDLLDPATKVAAQKSTINRVPVDNTSGVPQITSAIVRTNATESMYMLLFSRKIVAKLRVREGVPIFKGGKPSDDVMSVTFDNPFVVSRWDATSISDTFNVQVSRPVMYGIEDGSYKHEVFSNDVVSLTDPEGKCVGFVREVIIPMLMKLCIRWNNLCTVASNKLVTARSDFFYGFYPLSKNAKEDIQARGKAEIIEHLSLAAARYANMLNELMSDENLSKVPMENALQGYIDATTKLGTAPKVPTKPKKATAVKQFKTFPKMAGHGEVILSAPVIRSLTIAELLRMLEDESLRVPDFQRHFVWKAADMRQFVIDILANNEDEFVTDFLTIGVEANSHEEASSNYLEHIIDSDTSMKLLINGLQRLSTAKSFVNNQLALPPESFGTVMGDVEIYQLKQSLDELKPGGGKGGGRIKFSTLPTEMQERFLNTRMPVVYRAGDYFALGGLFTKLNLGKPLLTSEKMFSPAMFGEWFAVLKKFVAENTLFSLTFPAPSKTSSPERISTVSEAKLLNMVASYFGTFSGEPSADMTAIVAKLLRNNTLEDAEMFVTIMNNMLDYVFEVDCETQSYNKAATKNDKVISMNCWCMAAPGWYRWVMFVRFSTAFITVLKNFAETSGSKYDITKPWKSEFPFIYEQRGKVAKCIDAMVHNGAVGDHGDIKKMVDASNLKSQPVSQRVLTDAFATHMKPLALPFNDENHWKSFVDAMELPAYSASDPSSVDFPLDDYATYIMSVAEDTDASVLETIASVKLDEFSCRFIAGGNEDTCLRIMQDIPTNVGEHTNGSAVHIALHRYFMLVAFGLVV